MSNTVDVDVFQIIGRKTVENEALRNELRAVITERDALAAELEAIRANQNGQKKTKEATGNHA